jgi:hypothetical protein
MEQWQRSLDNWLTSEPSWRKEPLHFFTIDDGKRCNREDYTTEGECAGCEELVGAVQYAEKETSGMDKYLFINYWQIDEDGEHLLCEECYENEPLELDECVMCQKGAWINLKGRCKDCEEKS